MKLVSVVRKNTSEICLLNFCFFVLAKPAEPAGNPTNNSANVKKETNSGTVKKETTPVKIEQQESSNKSDSGKAMFVAVLSKIIIFHRLSCCLHPLLNWFYPF